jgi:LemA protein
MEGMRRPYDVAGPPEPHRCQGSLNVVAVIVIAAVLVLLLLLIVLIYNSLIRSRNRVDNAWSQIDVQLRRRYDLIPNLVETVKGYAAHERQTLEAVTSARTNAMNAQQSGNVQQQAQAENALTGALKSLFAVSEAYPDLKANQNFLQLQEELTSTEDRIAYARQFYNDSVLNYNNSIQVFPKNLLAGTFNFEKREFFETEPEEQGPVKVQF